MLRGGYHKSCWGRREEKGHFMSTTYHVQDCKESGVGVPSQVHTKPDTVSGEVSKR